MKNKVLYFFLFVSIITKAQSYAPPVGQPGCTAMDKDSSAFINWVKACTIVRGYQDISNTSLGVTSVGDESMALGKATSNGVISLGDGGSVICSFNYPIVNGPGNDFAVFENSIDDTFLELAFVEVSSDGVNFFRFRSHSLTDTLTQTGSFGSTDATKINNFAGKYRGGYGTPFDLQELAGTPGLNVNAITHVKVIDVVGSMNPAYASRDAFGNKVNDPWPTAFPSGGFDLDAIGVIHENSITSINENDEVSNVIVYPNPVCCGENVLIRTTAEFSYAELINTQGLVVLRTSEQRINTLDLAPGLYNLRIVSAAGIRTVKVLLY